MENINGVFRVVLLLIITLESFTLKMDSAELVYATVEEIIGKTGKTPPQPSTRSFRLQRRYYTS